MLIALAGLGLIGHLALCVAVINRLHAIGLRRPILRLADLLWYLFFFGVPVVVALRMMGWSAAAGSPSMKSPLDWLVGTYLALAVSAAIFSAVGVLRQRRCAPTTSRLAGNHTRLMDVSQELGQRPVGDFRTRLAARIPGNEILKLSIHEKLLTLPRLPAELHGLSIAHLSDLHFTGQLTADFFCEVVRRTNDLDCDIVAITGDIIDKSHCLPWLPDVLGRLTSRHGIFFILGNHELRIEEGDQVVRKALVETGMNDLGGRCEVIDVQGQQILLAGNELPWFGPAADMSDCPTPETGQRPLRICLSHSPDQFPWARAHDVDLMLAGHTHGGQCRLPLIGPILCPSRFGVRYASGAFYEPPTLLHVSRGVSGTRPVRFNCPPELPRLVLKCESS